MKFLPKSGLGISFFIKSVDLWEEELARGKQIKRLPGGEFFEGDLVGVRVDGFMQPLPEGSDVAAAGLAWASFCLLLKARN